MPLLFGTYKVTPDAKGRIAIPAKMRGHFQVPNSDVESIIITRGIKTYLTGYTQAGFDKLISDISNLTNIDEITKVDIIRKYTSLTTAADLDKQGRVLIPDFLLEFANLNQCSELWVVGMNYFIEIWNPELYKQQDSATESLIVDTLSKVSLSAYSGHKIS